MANSDDALREATRLFAAMYPRMTPEAIMAFFLVADEGMITMQELGAAIGLEEATLKQHLFLLAVATGAGLISISGQDGARIVNLSPAGKTAALKLNLGLK